MDNKYEIKKIERKGHNIIIELSDFLYKEYRKDFSLDIYLTLQNMECFFPHWREDFEEGEIKWELFEIQEFTIIHDGESDSPWIKDIHLYYSDYKYGKKHIVNKGEEIFTQCIALLLLTLNHNCLI